MVYLILLAVIFSLTLKGFCGKKLSCRVQGTSDAYLFNCLRMLMCAFIGIAFVFSEGSQAFLLPDAGMMAVCVFSGAANAAVVVCWMLSVQKNSMVAVDVGLTLGSLLPSVLCTLFFGEEFSFAKIIGFALIVCATVILAGRSATAAKSTRSGIFILVLTAVLDGTASFSQQLYKQLYTEAGSLVMAVYPKTVYHFYTYVFASLTLFVFLLFCYVRERGKCGGKRTDMRATVSPVSPAVLLHVLIMAACMFAANYLQTVATNDYVFSSQIMYPVIKAGCLITVNVTATLFFGEKTTLRTVLGSLVALCGIVAMSIL